MYVSPKKARFYRLHLKHYGQRIIDAADSEKVIDDIIAGKDLGALYNALREIVDVDWSFENKL